MRPAGPCKCATASASASAAARRPAAARSQRTPQMPDAFATKWSASFLASLTRARRKKFLASLTRKELESLTYDWRFWARPEQRPPHGDWHIWLILAGRGAGKTRSGAEWVREGVCGSTP